MRIFALAILAALALPASALAAPPNPTTKGVAGVTQSTATLTGTVNPRGNPTAIYFKLGPTKAYGSQTPDVDAGDGNEPKTFTAAINNLAPFTTYHYRIFARYGDKTVAGADRTFRTDRQPLGLTLAASSSSLKAGGNTMLTGNLAGTGNEGRQVELLVNAAPYAGGFQRLGNPQVVDATGAFSFPLLDVRVNTQYQVRIPGKQEVVSPIVFVGVRSSVSTDVRRVSRTRFRFKGRVSPSTSAKVIVQRRKNGRFKDVESDVTEGGRFNVAVRIRRKGSYRVQVEDLTNTYVANVGRTIKVRPKR